MVSEKNRYPLIDLMRFAAIALMVFFHLFYDLDQFGFVDIDFRKDPFWHQLPRLIITLFMLCVGMGLALSHGEKVRWHKVGRRFAQLAICAALISLATYVAFPKRWIYFGTIHSIAFSSVLALPFLRFPRLALALGLAANFCYWALEWRFRPFSRDWGIVSLDYVPLHPWMGVVLIGIFFHHWGLHRWREGGLQLPAWITWASRHSLKIYMLHQVILYGLVFAIHWLVK